MLLPCFHPNPPVRRLLGRISPGTSSGRTAGGGASVAITRVAQPEGCGRPSHSVVPNSSRNRCTPHSRCSARTRRSPRTGCRRCTPGMPRIPGWPHTSRSTDCRPPRRCPRCQPSPLLRRCPRSLPPRHRDAARGRHAPRHRDAACGGDGPGYCDAARGRDRSRQLSRCQERLAESLRRITDSSSQPRNDVGAPHGYGAVRPTEAEWARFVHACHLQRTVRAESA